MASADKPLIVLSDGTILLDVHAAGYEDARNDLAVFAELEKSPEHVHTYRLSPLSLWNAAGAGVTADRILAALERHGKYEIPQNVRAEILTHLVRYGKIRLEAAGEDDLRLVVADRAIALEIERNPRLDSMLQTTATPGSYTVARAQRGAIKRALIRIGYPVEDVVGFAPGEPLETALRSVTLAGAPFGLRDYQAEAAEVFFRGGSAAGGHGVVALPCGAGKTVVGMAVMARLQCSTLILVTNITAVRQWMRELLDKMTLAEDQVAEYTGERKAIAPVTIATYQILVYHKKKSGVFPHFQVFSARNWGLIIYDEVHLLPAPVFQITADIQAKRRLGLTATLVREDGLETEVFSLIGPKRYDVPWKDLERRGFIAEAYCHEIRIPLPADLSLEHAVAADRKKYRIAAENPDKIVVVRSLIGHHGGESILVIGQYLRHLEEIASDLNAPIITGATPTPERERLYDEFRKRRLPVLVVSKVANFAVDLPDASVAIQVSGTFGSRQEEAQRLGRILRPKDRSSYFYSIVSRDTVEQEYARKRQLFLTEQGYRYSIYSWPDAPWSGGPRRVD